MSASDPKPSKNLEEDSNWFQWLFITYLDNLFAKGYTRPLEQEDLGSITSYERADLAYARFRKVFDEEIKKNPNAKLWHMIWKTVGYWKLYLAIFLFAVSAAVQFGPVLILTQLVKYLAGYITLSTVEVWVFVCLLFVLPMVQSILLAHSNIIMVHCGAEVRNFLICAIYRKSLVLSSSSRQTISTGRIVTMFSEDTNQIRNFLFFLANTIVAPLQIGACLYLIYRQVGVATFVGLGFTIITMPINGKVFATVNMMRRNRMLFTDNRVKLMTEILNGIRIIKYYAWENALIRKLTEIRNSELAILRLSGYIFNTAMALLLLGAPNIQTVLIFYTYIANGNQQLTASIAFTTLTLFGLMTSPFIFLPFGLQQYSQSLISSGRILSFLLTEELEKYVETVDPGSTENIIEIEATNLSWLSKQEFASLESKAVEETKKEAVSKDGKYEAVSTSEDKSAVVSSPKVGPIADPVDGVNRGAYTLRDINLKIKKNSLVAIVGPVGCGKSSFLSAVLGEMYKTSGSFKMHQGVTTAYCDQRAWIINATVKDNILFGKPYDEVRFNQAIYATCMEDDLKILPAGVMTEIGERGINLSGGQKARVALARAVYNDADVYLLDDPLSAVDAHVGQHIFSKCIKEALGSKTRLFVTHHIHVLSQCDMIVILDEGKVKVSGTYDEIINSGIDITKYLPKAEGEEEEGKGLEVSTRSKTLSTGGAVEKDRKASSSSKEKESDVKGTTLMTKEEKSEGGVTGATYLRLIRLGGSFIFFSVIFCQCVAQVIMINANFWLAHWGLETTVDQFTPWIGHMSVRRNFHWMHGYAGMQMAAVFFTLLSRTSLVEHRLRACKSYHEQLLAKVLSTSVSFFDITPIGRVINRFSQDLATIDEDLAQTISQVIGMGGGCVGAVGAIIGATKGTFLLMIVPLFYLYGLFQAYFKTSNTAIARIEAVSRSPIYADFTQVLSGTASIRAYGQQQSFIVKLEGYINNNTVPGVYQQIGSQWLAIRLDLLGAVITFFMGVLAVATKNDNFISAGDLGLGLSYAIQLTGLLKMAVRLSATLEAQMNSVERFNYYIDNLQGEDEPMPASGAGGQKPATIENAENGSAGAYASVPTNGDIEMSKLKTPSSDWPNAGKIEFRDVCMRYRDGPLVLKNISFEVSSKEKVGFCGRTGCGKSSLMVALFRIENLASGQILIDDVDIATVPLPVLRKKLCIIPQDPVMFSSTVRFNLDPFNDFNDTELWEVLESVSMKAHVTSLPKKLEELVAEGGENFSAGQRQVCLSYLLL